MTTVTVKMPDDLHAALSKLAVHRGISKSQLIRDAKSDEVVRSAARPIHSA